MGRWTTPPASTCCANAARHCRFGARTRCTRISRAGNPILRVLEHYCGVERHAIPLDGSEFAVAGVPGLRFAALPLASKAAPYSPHRDAPVPATTSA